MGEVEQCTEQLPRAPTVGALGDAVKRIFREQYASYLSKFYGICIKNIFVLFVVNI